MSVPPRVVGAQVGRRHRWLGTALQLGNLHEVSRKVAAWTRAPDAAFSRKLDLTPNPKAISENMRSRGILRGRKVF